MTGMMLKNIQRDGNGGQRRTAPAEVVHRLVVGRALPAGGVPRLLAAHLLEKLRNVSDAVDRDIVGVLLRFAGGDEIVVFVEKILHKLHLHLIGALRIRRIAEELVNVSPDVVLH